MLKQKGKAKAHLRAVNLPPSKSKQSKYQDLHQQLKETLPSRIQDWDDLSDKEKKGIEEAEYLHGKFYINTHPDDDKDMSGTASSSTLPDPTATTPQPHIPMATELAQAISHITLLIREIGTKVSNLADEVTQLAQLKGAAPAPMSVSALSTVACPKAWEGKNGSAEARHFLATFNNWVFMMNSNRLGRYTHIRSVCEWCAVGVNIVQKQVMAGTPVR